MLTSRGWWLLLTVLGVLITGMLGRLPLLTLTGLCVLLWFLWEWLLFSARIGDAKRRIVLERSIQDDRGEVATLWAGRAFRITATIRARGVRLPHVLATDLVPFDGERLDGDAWAEGALDDQQCVVVHYRLRCRRPGMARFEGVRLQLADLHGFFYHVAFVQAPIELPVLPPLLDAEARPASSKRYNLLPPPGVHRLRRPGSGSELLDLRDYLPGDPPKTIAWKVSARRDRLITKEFESEVPVRCTLFVDASASVRVPSPEGTAATRLAEIAAGVAQSSAAVRDLTGLCLFDEKGVRRWLRPERSPRHLNELLRALAETAALPPAPTPASPEPLVPLAYTFTRDVYPQQLRTSLNGMTFWSTWISGFPGHRRYAVSWTDALHRFKDRVLLAGMFYVPTILSLGSLCMLAFAPLSDEQAVTMLIVSAAASLLSSVFALLWFGFSTLVSERRRRLGRWRKQLAAILSVRYGGAPGSLAALMEDDDQLSMLLQRYLADHRIPYAVPLYDEQGEYRFRAPAKVEALGTALLHAIARGRDNELFVLMVDLIELHDRLEPLDRAVRVALARHHQVVLLCPWPAGLDLPPRGGAPADVQDVVVADEDATAALVRDITRKRFHEGYERVRRNFVRLGVQVICAASDEAVPLVLDRLERLHRAGRRA